MRYRFKHDERNGILHFKATEPMAGYWRYWPSPEFAPYVEWPDIALDLGYSDQAHFIREFKQLIGKSPADYFDSLSQPAEADANT